MLGEPETEAFFAALRSLEIRLPNPKSPEQQHVNFEDAIRQEVLSRLFQFQYHTDKNRVEFIPRYIRPFIDDPRFFYKDAARPTDRDPKEKSQNPVLTAGFEHELLVQDKFEGLEKSELFSGDQITVFHNMKKDYLKYNKLKKFMNNEFDLIVFHVLHGVFVVETKRREHEKFTGKSLEKELIKQQKRKKFLCLIKTFLQIDVPITPVILTSIVADDTENKHKLDKHENDSYVLGVNFGSDTFDKTWRFFLDQLGTNSPQRKDVEIFAATLDALLHCGDTPSRLYLNLTGGSVTSPGDLQRLPKQRSVVIWTKQQRQVKDFIQDTLTRNAEEFEGGNARTSLRLLISGCFGSGKTLMLSEAAKFFCSVNKNSRKVVYVIFDMKGDTFLLNQQLQESYKADKVTQGRITVINLSNFSAQAHCCQLGYILSQGSVDLLLLDEYYLYIGPGLICSSHDRVPNILITTRYKMSADLWEAKLGPGFVLLELNGNIRSSPDICRYISKVESVEVWSEQICQDPVALTLDHNARGRSSIEEIDLNTMFGPGFVCDTIVSRIQSIREKDEKERIYVITNTVKDGFLESLSDALKNLEVPIGNVRYFFGCEASTVIYIGRKKDDVVFGRDDAISRASVNLVVYNLV